MQVPPDIAKLVSLVPSPPDEPLPCGATDSEIQGFSQRTGIEPPPELCAWWRFVNGPCIGPGGIYGIRPARPELDVERILGTHPAWTARPWIPIAGDGCGNHYVLAADGSLGSALPVFFFDHEQGDPLAVDYVVASSLWPFLRFLLQKELGERRWPFDRDFVLSTDPELRRCSRLPWDDPA